MSEAKVGAGIVCSRCGRGIECCAVCETETCHECLCYRCLIVSLGHSRAHPHEHGG